MTKKDVANQISERTGLDQREVMLAIETFAKVINENVAKGKTIYIRNFATFGLIKRKAKKARNIKAGTTIHLPEKWKPFFKVPKSLHRKVEKLPI